MGISRAITDSVILSNESPLYSPGLSSRMQFKMQLDSKLLKGQIYKSPMGSGIVKHLGAVWIPFFNHSISVTHHSSLKIPYSFGTITHLSLLNIFHTVCGPHTCHSVQPFFFFFFLPVSLNPVKKEKEKKKPRSEGRRRSHLV